MNENEKVNSNTYPNVSFVRALVEDSEGNQQIVVAMSTNVRFKEDLSRGTMITASIFYDVDLSIEESYPVEMALSDEFHRTIRKVYEEGIEALDPETPTFDIDDPDL